MNKSAEEIAQWAVNNRYPKSETEKLSDFEYFEQIKESIKNSQLACLQKASENAMIEDVTPISRMYGARVYEVDKSSIYTEDNLI